MSHLELYPRLVQVSTVYNKAIATGNTDIIVNSVIVLFVMDLDEWIFASLKAWNKKWTAHSSDSDSSSEEEESSSGSEAEAEAEKGGAIEEMKEEISLQKGQLESQQEELMRQKDQLARQNDEIAMLRETFQKMQDSFAVSAGSIAQSPSSESVTKTMHTSLLEGTVLESDAAEKNGLVNDMEGLASESLDCHREEDIRIPSDTE